MYPRDCFVFCDYSPCLARALGFGCADKVLLEKFMSRAHGVGGKHLVYKFSSSNSFGGIRSLSIVSNFRVFVRTGSREYN
jgi:hypothetical protein